MVERDEVWQLTGKQSLDQTNDEDKTVPYKSLRDRLTGCEGCSEEEPYNLGSFHIYKKDKKEKP